MIEEQRQPTFDENGISRSYYNFTGLSKSSFETLLYLQGLIAVCLRDGERPYVVVSPIINGGNGSPKAYTGLVATSHRPSGTWTRR